MGKLSKTRKTAKLTAAQKTKITNALALITAQYADAAAVWPQLTAEQQRRFLDHSPVLASICNFAKRFEVSNGG
mgnify:CR=1 FL=1